MKTVNNFSSEVTEIATSAGKALTVFRSLDENYMVFDPKKPSDKERKAYERGCGEVYSLLCYIEECLNRIYDSAAPLLQEV